MNQLSAEELNEMRQKIDTFSQMLDKFPAKEVLEKTPDGKAFTLPISHVESRLDTFFFGQWGTEDFTWQVCQNEIIGKITLWVIHPVTMLKINRVGAASVQITVDALDQDIKSKMSRKQVNEYALNVANKKPNSLYLLSGKLKAECFKNAAQSFGKALGKDLNRKSQATFTRLTKASTPKAELPQPSQSELKKAINLIEEIEIPLELKNEFVKTLATNTTSVELVKKVLAYGR